MEKLFAGITPAASYKAEGENNPLFTQRFGADPGVMEYNGRVYVYTTNDVIEMTAMEMSLKIPTHKSTRSTVSPPTTW